MCNYKKCSLVGIDQIPQCIQTLKIQKNIRFIHNKQSRTQHHLFDDLDQFKFPTT